MKENMTFSTSDYINRSSCVHVELHSYPKIVGIPLKAYHMTFFHSYPVISCIKNFVG